MKMLCAIFQILLYFGHSILANQKQVILQKKHFTFLILSTVCVEIHKLFGFIMVHVNNHPDHCFAKVWSECHFFFDQISMISLIA